MNANATARVSSAAAGCLRGVGGRVGRVGGMGRGGEVKGYRRLTRAKRTGRTLGC